MSRSSAGSKPSFGNCSDSETAEEASGLDLTAGDGFVARLKRAASPYARRLAEAPAVRALQESLPVIFGTAVAALLLQLGWQLLNGIGWGAALRALPADLPRAFTLASAVTLLVLPRALAQRLRFPGPALGGVSFIAFLLALPREVYAHAPDAAMYRVFGTSGIFTAIVVSLASAGAFALGRQRFGARRGTLAGAVAIAAAFAVLFALGISPASLLATALAPLAALGDSFAALLIIVAIESLLWLVGIHGPALLAAVVFPVYLNLQLQNAAAFAHHQPLPHLVVVSTFVFVFPGGAGATFPLVVLLLRSRVRRLRKVGLATIVPALFNLNEPVIFGLPVAYNPVLAVPFVVAPLVLACTTCAAMALSLVGRPVFYVPSTLPSLVNAFLATLDWRACVLMVLNLAIAGAIWFPFVRVYERAEEARTRTARAA